MGGGAKIVQLNPDLSAQFQSGSGSPSGPAGGDTSGSYPNPSVVALQGTPICVTAPTLGDVLTFDGTDWCPAAPAPTGITVEDEGTPLATAATTLNFVGAGVTASGTTATKTITIPGTTTPLPWFNAITDGGCVADGVTDDTAAIQYSLDTATASWTQSAIVYFPPGVYLIAGALTSHGQIQFGVVATEITITLVGAARPPLAGASSAPGVGSGYSILKSTTTSGAGSTDAVFQGGTSTNRLQVVLENLLCIAPNDPTVSFWYLPNCQGGATRNVMVATVGWGSATQPNNLWAAGLVLPKQAESNYTYVDGFEASGFYVGLIMGELSICKGLIFAFCIEAVRTTFAYHANLIIDMEQTYCKYGIAPYGACAMDVLQYDAEHDTGGHWYTTVYDLADPSNLLTGHIRWWGVTSGTGVDHSFTITGGSHVLAEEIGQAPAGAMTNPMTTVGDLIVSGTVTGGVAAPARLGIGALTTVLHGGTTPAYSAVVEGDLSLANVTTANVSTTKHGFAPILPNDSTKFLDGTGAWTVPPGTASAGTDHEHVMDCLFSGDSSTVAFTLPVAPFDQWSVAAYVAGVLTEITLSGALLDTATFGSAPTTGTDNIRFDIVAAVY